MTVSEYKIKGQTKHELISEFFLESEKLRRFKRKAKKAPNKTVKTANIILMDVHGNLAQVALLRIGLFDRILMMEVFS